MGGAGLWGGWGGSVHVAVHMMCFIEFYVQSFCNKQLVETSEMGFTCIYLAAAFLMCVERTWRGCFSNLCRSGRRRRDEVRWWLVREVVNTTGGSLCQNSH